MQSLRTALIVGGGIAGPAAALALARIGVRSTIVESHPGPADGVGAILTLAANGLDVLRTLGAETPVTDAAQLITEVQMADAAGQVFARHPGGGYVLPRDLLARILSEHAASTGAEIRYGAAVTDISSSAHAVTARLADGSVREADLLIGADGIHSTIRTLIDPDAPAPVFEGVLGFGAATDPDGVHAEPGVMHFAFGQRFLGYWRLPDGRICWYAALASEALTSREIAAIPTAEWLARLRADYAGDAPAATLLARTSLDDLISTGPTLRMPPVPHWHRDRVVLVGDAVHAPSSTSGQGASLALESAIELARALRDLPDIADAFTAYEQIRRPRVEAIAAMAAAANNRKAGRAPEAGVPAFDPTEHRIDFDRTIE
ncbi:FAD-dependent monooxygenase [Microbacterium sp.]|uniref:FAD-dependent monooxygenase n=1 Tax=Microbacterium sp. TaxID=51671 RepID=UPI0039E6876B